MVKLDEATYEKKLKEPLECFRCAKEFKTIPALKTHLQEEFDRMAHRGKAAEADRKRKRNEETEENTERDDLNLKQEKKTENSRKVLAHDSTFEASSQTESKSGEPRKKQKST